MPDLKCRLLIPQDHFMELERLENPGAPLTLTWDKYFLKISYQVPITIKYENTTHPTMLHSYKKIYITTESLTMTR